MALLFGVWAGALALWWQVKWIRVVCLATALLLLAIMVLPGRGIDSGKLRNAYVESLRRYEGTRYVWGGENMMGIDCSGLVRRGLIDAMLRQGAATANPSLIRQSFLMRWFDCSALAMQEGYRGQTFRLMSAPSIAKLDHNLLLPGDFAVTADGVHTLAYLGDSVWIEADPGAHRVIRVGTNEENGWLAVPVDIIRWRIFEDKRPVQ